MKNALRLLLISAFVILVSAPALFAEAIPETSMLPVDQPLDVGGTILQPGIYMVRTMPESADRGIIQITSQDGKTVIANVLTVPHVLGLKEEKPSTEFVYYPAGEGQPRALRTWFPADANRVWSGKDIVYEESRAKQLARLAKSNVVSYTGPVETAQLETVTPTETIEVYHPPVVTDTESRRSVAGVETERTEVAEAHPMEMPRTAGSLPMIALLGFISLAAATAFRFIR